VIPVSLIFLKGSNANGGSMESRSMGVQRYHETASNRSPPNFQHPPPINHQHHNLHHPGPLTHGVRGQTINFQPQVAAPSYRVSTNLSRSSLNPPQNSLEMGHRHPGSVPPTGFRIYHQHRGGVVPEATLRHRNLPHLRVLQADVFSLLLCHFSVFFFCK
jgi:E3 ubiquitin-protein ligase RNF38/44